VEHYIDRVYSLLPAVTQIVLVFSEVSIPDGDARIGGVYPVPKLFEL